MQIFVLSATETGTATFARHLQRCLLPAHSVAMYDAAGWVREGFVEASRRANPNGGLDETNPEGLRRYAADVLEKQPLFGVVTYARWRNEAPVAEIQIILGVTSPEDFVGMAALDRRNAVIRIEPEEVVGTDSDLAEEGLQVIDQHLLWRAQAGRPMQVIDMPRAALFNTKAIEKVAASLL